MNDEPTQTSSRARDINPDPRTGEPGTHAVSTGVGATAGGIAGAVVGSVGGPIGAAAGAVIGVVAGGFAGRGVAEAIDPAAEDAYWHEKHRAQPYAEGDFSYEDYAPDYRAGFLGFRAGQTFEEREAELRREYESAAQKAGAEYAQGAQNTTTPESTPGTTPPHVSTYPLRWENARAAARAAYERVGRGEARRVESKISGTNAGQG